LLSLANYTKSLKYVWSYVQILDSAKFIYFISLKINILNGIIKNFVVGFDY